MLRDHPGRTIGAQHHGHGVVGGDDCRGDRVEHRARVARKQLPMPPEPGRPRGERVEDVIRNRQLGRADRTHQRVERRTLRVRRDGLDRLSAVAAHRVDVVHATDGRRGCVDLETMVQVERHEDLFHRGERHVASNGRLAEVVERGAPDVEHAVKLGRRIDAVRPLMHARVGVEVLVRQIDKIPIPRVVEDLLQGGWLVSALRKVLIPVGDGHLVPFADPDVVGVREVDLAVVVERDERVRVVENGHAPERAGVVVVAQPERVADLVGSELADPGECHLRQCRRHLVAPHIRRQQPFGDQEILPDAERPEGDDALDDLAGARVGDRAATAPAAGRAVHPVDHVVAHVEVVGPFRQ